MRISDWSSDVCSSDLWNLLRSSAIGTVIGILPAAGGAIASLVAYAEARRASRTPERFGRGEPNGVLATEAANNATVGAGFIPTLTLGIPGRPEERPVGTECASTCSSRWSPSH